ncbi:MAG: hypothetical protein JWP31_568 [Aeromicrobium sp.]|nr:hypothetical protein [Aeromicrobium sp.]
MRPGRLLVHDGGMNQTQATPSPAGPDDEFDARRLRSITDMQRSRDDRIVAGVCAGAARYLNVDPVVIRVVLAVLTVAGFAGVILYVAAWLLLPADDEDTSIVAGWLNLDKNEEQVRVAGLVGAVIIATLSVVGDSSWSWWGDTPWWIVPFALVFYVFWVRPRRRREARAQRQAASDPATIVDDHASPARADRQRSSRQRQPRSPALLLLTASLAAIALAGTWIYEETQGDIDWTTYVAVALAVVGVGLLIGTSYGHGGPLIAVGLVLAITLAIGSVFPDGRIGEQTPTPTVAADVKASYRHGIGLLELDLSTVSDPDRLLGRTITVRAGVGQTRIIVPDGLNLDVSTDLRVGEVSLFGRHADGPDIALTDSADQPGQPSLSIKVDQKVGDIEVIRR